MAPDDPDELLSADRRTLGIAAGAMVLLVLIGLISAQLFGRSACVLLDAVPRTERPAGAEAEAILAATVGQPVADGVLGGLGDLARQLGQVDAATERSAVEVVGAADVSGARRLTTSVDGVVALGTITTSLTADLGAVHATAEVGEAVVVGSGDPLYQLVLPNLLTGQVDAHQPLTSQELTALTCVDTAVVGSPLAFHLAAGDGELLLYRAEEDGDDARLELRDPVAGQVWRSFISLPTGPPGTIASRLRGALGPDVAVVAYPAVPGASEPVVVLADRTDGQLRWALGADVLHDAVVAALAADPASVAAGLPERVAEQVLHPTTVAAGQGVVAIGVRSAASLTTTTPAPAGATGTLAGESVGESAGESADDEVVALVGIDAVDGSVRFVLSGETLGGSGDAMPETVAATPASGHSDAPGGAIAVTGLPLLTWLADGQGGDGLLGAVLTTPSGARLVAFRLTGPDERSPDPVAVADLAGSAVGLAGSAGWLAAATDQDLAVLTEAGGAAVALLAEPSRTAGAPAVTLRDVTVTPAGTVVVLVADDAVSAAVAVALPVPPG